MIYFLKVFGVVFSGLFFATFWLFGFFTLADLVAENLDDEFSKIFVGFFIIIAGASMLISLCQIIIEMGSK